MIQSDDSQSNLPDQASIGDRDHFSRDIAEGP